jgi:predicted nucleotidyltransferase
VDDQTTRGLALEACPVSLLHLALDEYSRIRTRGLALEACPVSPLSLGLLIRPHGAGGSQHRSIRLTDHDYGMTPTAHRAALDLAERLAGLDHVQSVCLLGSAARGDAEPGSDIDLLAVVDAREHVNDVRRRALGACRVQTCKVQTKVLDEARLAEMFTGRSTFAVHVLREAVIVRDEGHRFTRLRAQHSPDAPVKVDPAALQRRLELYDNLDWCQGLYLYCLADCYSTGRAAAYALLGQLGIFEFSAGKALTRVADEWPELRRAAERIARLRPFFVLADRDIHQPLPFPYRDHWVEAETAVRAAHQLIGALEHDAARR